MDMQNIILYIMNATQTNKNMRMQKQNLPK